MSERKPIISEELQLEMDAPFISKTVARLVEIERSRGWAFKNDSGHYQRQDALDRLLAAGKIDHLQHQAGKRYQRQYGAAYEYGRCVSTLEFRRSDHALSDAGVQSALYLGQAQRQALDLNGRLIGAMAQACERQTTVSDLIGLRVALTRLVDYYAELEDESEEMEAPEPRTLQSRAASIAGDWIGSDQGRGNVRMLQLLYDAQCGRCAICGALLERDRATLDHVVPKGVFWG